MYLGNILHNSDSAPENFSDTREAFQERVIQSIIYHAEFNLYLPPTNPQFPNLAMPFHNTSHMHHVHDKVVELGEYVRENGKQPDMFALRLAAVLHDAKYFDNLKLINQEYLGKNLIKKTFENKEAYSAWLAKPLLKSFGVESTTVRKVQRLIRKTHYQAQPRTLEEKMLVRADLDNISGPRTPFVMNTLALVREAEKLDGPKNPFERIAFLYNVLDEYVSKDLSFGDFDKDVYDKTFKKPALANIARITEHNIKGTIRHLGRQAVSFLPSLSKAS